MSISSRFDESRKIWEMKRSRGNTCFAESKRERHLKAEGGLLPRQLIS
jgi:hypothetical protein